MSIHTEIHASAYLLSQRAYNFKTKPSFDKRTMSYDRAFENTAFLKKEKQMTRAPAYVRAFQ